MLNVSKKTIKKYGAVSYQCCLEMIKNLSKLSKNNIALSITGIAGPKGSSINKPVGLVFIVSKPKIFKKFINLNLKIKEDITFKKHLLTNR